MSWFNDIANWENSSRQRDKTEFDNRNLAYISRQNSKKPCVTVTS